jgi:hypothetical protein
MDTFNGDRNGDMRQGSESLLFSEVPM